MARVETLRHFRGNAKRLSKKFRSLLIELYQLINELEVTPRQGTALGTGFYKIRLASQSKVGGKSGGFRIIPTMLNIQPKEKRYI